MAARRNDDWEVSPTELLEQAFHLLRTLSPSELAPCLIGPVPFVIGILFFWMDMTVATTTASDAAGWAVILALLYLWMKGWQAVFARTVWNRLLPEGGLDPLRSGGRIRRLIALGCLSAFSIPLHFIAANLFVPFAWTHAFFQNAIVLALTQPFDQRTFRQLTALSLRQSHHEVLQNHIILLLLLVFSIIVWAGIYLVAAVLPGLFSILTGVESTFSRNPGAAVFNTLFLAATIGAAWLVLSPFFRVTYVLRNFYALSRRSGTDLLSRLQAIRTRASTTVLVLVFGGVVAQSTAAPPEDGPVRAPEATERELGEAIRSTLEAREYQWRVPIADAAQGDEESGLTAMLRRLRQSVFDFVRSVSETIRRWWDKLFGVRGQWREPSGAGGISPGVLRGLIYFVSAVTLLLLTFAVVRWLRLRRAAASNPGAAAALPGADLLDEATLASQLPEDQWMRLAGENLAAGELRLAARALFLATLATLGEQRLIEIARSKSNRDYRNELGLRARGRGELQEAFGENVGIFERVWYGLHEVGSGAVETLTNNYHRIKRAPLS